MFRHLKSLVALTFIAVLLSSAVPVATPKPTAKIQWISMEEAFRKIQQEPRKVLIDVYTDWCGWCKRMDQTTFSNAQVAEYVNKHYYAVKFDAEQRETITLGDQSFKYVAEGRRGYHELAAALLQGKMSYPTVVFLDDQFNMIQPIPGFQDAKNFHKIVTYLGGDHHKSEEFEAFVAGTYTQKYQQ